MFANGVNNSIDYMDENNAVLMLIYNCVLHQYINYVTQNIDFNLYLQYSSQ